MRGVAAGARRHRAPAGAPAGRRQPGRAVQQLDARLLLADRTAAGGARTPQLAQAFEVGERLRARVLLEHLTRAGLPQAEAVQPRSSRRTRQRLQPRIVGHPAAAAGPALGGPGASRAPRAAAAPGDRRGRTRHRAGPAAVAPPPCRLRRSKRFSRRWTTTEAMLWFSIAPWQDLYGDFGGGSWLVVVTPRRAPFIAFPSDDLDGRVAALVGLLRDRETPAGRGSRRAWSGHDPARTGGRRAAGASQRLVIVSDGELHRLPFEALRPAAESPRLGEQFEITLVPSATLWLRLRQREAGPRQRRRAGPRRSGCDAGKSRRRRATRTAAVGAARSHAIARMLRLDADSGPRGRRRVGATS